MEVTLLHYTPIEPLIKATAIPYQSEKSTGLVKRVWDSGHRSIARHGMASFLVKNVSVSLLTQISRHPHINLTVQSSRYCDMSGKNCVLPPFLVGIDEVEFMEDYDKIMKIYKDWSTRKYLSKQEQREISKMFLPKASTVDMVVSGNYQALYEFLQLRNCKRAEWEIRELAGSMTNLLKEVMPEIFKNLGCKGDEYKICPETHGSCGKYPTKNNVKIMVKTDEG